MDNFSGCGITRSAGGRLLTSAVRGERGGSHQHLNACSACAGDYEDPDRTAWTPDPDEDEELPRDRAHEKAEGLDEHDDKFPAQEE